MSEFGYNNPFQKHNYLTLSPYEEHRPFPSFPKYFTVNLGLGSQIVMWLLSKVLSIQPMGQGASWEEVTFLRKQWKYFGEK